MTRMHPRKRLAKIISEVQQLITDTQSWNDNRPECEAMDCEVERIVLQIATQAANEWDSGDVTAAQKTMKRLSDYAKEQETGS